MLTDEQRLRALALANLQGFGGECGSVAVALNRVLFDGRGKYVAALNEALRKRGHFVGHVAVEHKGKIWDAAGYELTGRRSEFLGEWCVVDREEYGRLTQKEAENGSLWRLTERDVLRRMPGHCGVADPEKKLREAVARLVRPAVKSAGSRRHGNADSSLAAQHAAIRMATPRLAFGEPLYAAGVNGDVRVWRGVPSYAEDSIRPGDLVTTDPDMAWNYASRRGKLIEADVDASLLTYHQRTGTHEVELRFAGRRPTGRVVRRGP